jgi:hypothetical protein
MKLIEQNCGLRRSLGRRSPKRSPHVHHRQADATALLGAKPVVEGCHAGLGAIGAAKPDWPATNEVAHDDAIVLTFTDRDFVGADHFRSWGADARQLSCHVLLVELLDRIPIKVELLGHILDRCLAAPPANKIGKALGEMRVVGKELKVFAFHFASRPATYAPHFELEKYPRVAAGEIAHATDRAVVPAVMQASTTSTSRFFERRLSLMMRAFGSPKMPHTVASGRNTGIVYASHNRRFRTLKADIRKTRLISSPVQMLETLQ